MSDEVDDLGTAGREREPTRENLKADAESVARQVLEHWHGLVHPVVILFNPRTKVLAWGSSLDAFSARAVLREAAGIELQGLKPKRG